MMNPLTLAGNVTQLYGQLQGIKATNRDLAAAEANLSDIRIKGTSAAISPEMSAAYQEALKNYADAKKNATFGLSPEQRAAAEFGIERQQTGQKQAALNAGGSQMSRYMNAVLGNQGSENILDLAAKDAALKLQKEQFASTQLSPVTSMATGISDRYTDLLREAGRAVSDLRMQKRENVQGAYTMAGNQMQQAGQKLDKDASKFAMGLGKDGSFSSIPAGYKQRAADRAAAEKE
jgi:hypothetical protein